MRKLLFLLVLLLPFPGWAGDPVGDVDFFLFQKSDANFRACENFSGAKTETLGGRRFCVLPANAITNTRMKGDFSRSQVLVKIPGPITRTVAECTDIPGSVVVVMNGVRYCMGPASAVSHNSSRSNFSR